MSFGNAQADSQLTRHSRNCRGSRRPPSNFDVFLSYSFRDAVLILGLKRVLEGDGLSVYVDWIEDPQLDRARVNATTAAHLRERMKRCRLLVYATSQNASTSRWMPWELGFFDGVHGPDRVAICPIARGAGSYTGEEYLGLYKTLEKVRDAGLSRPFVRHIGRPSAWGPSLRVAAHFVGLS